MLRSSLFIVRVWRQRDRGGDAAFRASVRAVNAERGRMFARPSDVARYLVRNGPDEPCGGGTSMLLSSCTALRGRER